MKGVLEGIRILELGNFISGPYAAVLLADMGAEVIKVENPKGGDPVSRLGSRRRPAEFLGIQSRQKECDSQSSNARGERDLLWAG